MQKQLQRTVDGATEKSRIRELAEIVKLVRRCLKEMGSRTTLYIDKCVKLERDAAQQVEAVKLSSQTSLKQLEAELASTRQSLAECERDFRNDKAKWGSDLETQRGEAARLLRDLERLTEERDRARDEAKRNDQLRQQIEGELKDLRKSASQQMREVSVNQSEAVRILTEEKTAAENKIITLREENRSTQTTLRAAQDFVSALEQEAHMLRASVENLKGSLAGKEAAAAVQSEQMAKLHKELAQSKEHIASLVAAEEQLKQEAELSSSERAELMASLELRTAELDHMRERLRAQEEQSEEQRASMDAQMQELQAQLSTVTAERASLYESITLAKTALAAITKQKEAAEASLARESVEKTTLMREHTNLQHQMEFAESRQAQLEQEASTVRARLESLEAELAASRQLIEEKDARLAHLEGEFGALKEVLGETAAAAGGAGGSKDIVTTLLSKIATLQNAAAAAEAVRRKLHNELVDLRGNIRVYCRVRPHPTPSTRLAPDGASIHLALEGREHTFSYDRVFGPDSSQESVFGTVSELVQSALDGFHVCIFSYGQTGAGKTHTMQGGESPNSRGIIPRAVDKILSTARKLEEQAEWSYSMEASFIEIYNNQLRDLLGTGPAGSSFINDLHAIKHDPDGGHTVVSGVSKVPVTDSEGAAQLVRRAAAARAVEATAMNSVSSRSHSVFMLYISGWHAGSGTRLQGCLCLVDLAGSERLDRSQAEGQAKKEACAINASLSSLGDVFAALSSKSSHVPYRNSKLTYLLQPCLGGSGKTLMFVNINPEPASAGESLCSLRFAAKVSGCETGAKGGARRNVMQLGGGSGEAGPSAGSNLADPSRPSLSGLPRPPAGGVGAADKRMSLLPQRAAGDSGAGRISLAGARPGSGAGAAHSVSMSSSSGYAASDGQHVLAEDDLLGLATSSGRSAGLAAQHPTKELVKLVGKPQPRARTRTSPTQTSLADTDSSEGVGGHALDAERVRSGSEAGPSGRGLPKQPALQREETSLGLPLKTHIVRRAARELQDRAAQLADIIPDPSVPELASLTRGGGPARAGRRGGSLFTPRAGERMPQLKLAQMNRQRRLRGGQSGEFNMEVSTLPGPGLEASGSELHSEYAAPEPATSPNAGGRQYGRPPLRSTPLASAAAAAPSSPSSSSASVASEAASAAQAATAEAADAAADLAALRPTRPDFEKLVRATTDLEGLRTVYGKYVGVMVREEFVLMANQLASMSEPMNMSVKVWAATQGMLVQLLQHITPKLDSLTMQEYVVMLAAVAKLRYVPPNDWIAAVLTQSKTRLYNATPAYLTTTLRALARIAVDPADIKEAAAWESWMKRYLTSAQRQLSTYRADELVKTLVALSELRYRPPAEWMARFAAALHSRLDNLEAHSLSEAMLAFAALRYQPEGPFLRAYYSQLYSRLPLADDRDLATFAQAAALLDRLIRQEFMHEFLAEVLQKLPTFKAGHLANLLNAMGRLAGPPAPRVRPPPGWTASVAAHLSGPGRLTAFNGSALASAAWGLSALGHQASPKFLDDLLSASYGKLHACGPTDLVLLLTALGNFSYSPAPGREAFWDTWMTEFEKLAARKAYDMRGVCDLMAALARLPRPRRRAASGGQRPAGHGGSGGGAAAELVVRPAHAEFVNGVLRSTRMHNLRNTSPARLAALAGSLATLGIKPDFGFLYNYAQAARFMWAGFSMRDYATLLGAMVHVGTPGVADPRWAGDFLAIIMCRMSEFDGPGLAAALDALQHLPKPEFEPSRQWLVAAAARAVDLVRSPPPPPQLQQQQLPAGAAAPMAAAGAALPLPPPPAPEPSAPDADTTFAPLAFRPGELQGGVTLLVSPEGRMMPVQPQQPLTPELLLVAVRALAALGHQGMTLPGGVERTPAQLAAAQARWEAKLAARAAKAQARKAAEASENSKGSDADTGNGGAATGDGSVGAAAAVQDGAVAVGAAAAPAVAAAPQAAANKVRGVAVRAGHRNQGARRGAAGASSAAGKQDGAPASPAETANDDRAEKGCIVHIPI
ncbi:hypothetical protein GPECTOR_76g809 [Gonium pectorale]|uniref:Kinesin motor domain-containing protein n=1 Tax=Gonium pectorale TaxID=33097 RepID=A0A150G2B8_GONPE|nr:hypothetical protein GPECTOR_76g809 [Gonium pectorale]|eukprot:KXZ43987.1 hypothetical protein GPECTOR_76g809 [Gonium pectorale]